MRYFILLVNDIRQKKILRGIAVLSVLFTALSCLILAYIEGPWMTPRVSPSRAPVFFRAHYFQASATQASLMHVSIFETLD